MEIALWFMVDSDGGFEVDVMWCAALEYISSGKRQGLDKDPVPWGVSSFL